MREERSCTPTNSGHLEWWKSKLSRMGDRTFWMPKWGPHVLDVLMASDEGRVRASSLKDLAVQLGVPLKFVPRTVASVNRLGIVTADLRPPAMSVMIHPDRLARRKIALGRRRLRLSPSDQEALKAQSDYRCACCGVRFDPRQLVLDHLIPLSLLGADDPANLVAMSKQHNARKWDRLLRDDLKFYRRERVQRRFGVRFVAGAFWPVINGQVRYSSLRAKTGGLESTSGVEP